jgi:hypothetical protein
MQKENRIFLTHHLTTSDFKLNKTKQDYARLVIKASPFRIKIFSRNFNFHLKLPLIIQKNPQNPS